ncbi:hypothetical protein CEP54_011769 [Fusarium duplospermum]|uniref:Uncharacterized protein n=1 Tax=Fusarium duplospermum TaxID=1325734 RepID=A0A428PCS5_9HYPO|nr:hypothetical protein CEP54_011769 [Fusarium duplospermum]
MPELWKIEEILANPRIIKTHRKVITTTTFISEFGLRHKTHEQFVDKVYDAIEGLEILLEQNKRLTSIASRIKGQEAEWRYELEHRSFLRYIRGIDRDMEERCLYNSWFPHSHFDEDFVNRLHKRMELGEIEIGTNLLAKAKFIRDSGGLPAVPNDEASSLTDQQDSQLQGPQQVYVPSLMAPYSLVNNDEIRNQALNAMVVLKNLFGRVKVALVLLWPHFGNKDMEEGPKELLQDIIIDLFDYGHDMCLLDRYVNELQNCKSGITNTVLRHGIITDFQAGKFDRATSRLANHLKDQLLSIERIAAHLSPYDIPLRNSPWASLTDSIERGKWEKEISHKRIYDAEQKMEMLKVRNLRSEGQRLLGNKSFESMLRARPLILRLEAKLRDQPDREALVETLGQDFVKAIFEGACNLYEAESLTVHDITLKLQELLDRTPLSPDPSVSQT